MAANITPIFPLTPKMGIKTLTTADTSLSAPTTQGFALLTAGTNGMRLDAIKAKALGTNVQTVLRVFVNDGLGTAAVNFALVAEYDLPAITLDADNATTEILLKPLDTGESADYPTKILPPAIPAGAKIYVSIGTTVAAGWAITGLGGDY